MPLARRSGGQGRAEAADTIYFGGGTPSLLEPGGGRAHHRRVRATRFDVAPDAEVTLEANPETVTVERLAGFRDAGVNRVSFGVQSFRDDELRRLSRLHGADRARGAVAEARAAGFDNVSLDLMMWLPGQRVERVAASRWTSAIALAPEHLSLYMLEVYPNAPLKDEMARAQWSQAPDDDAAAMYLTAMERLDAAGYAQYEISNVARPGRASRHNLKYWTDGEWLGFGCGAHSTRGRRALEECRRPPRNTSTASPRGQSAAVDVRRLSRRRTAWRCAVYRTASDRRHRSRRDRSALRRGRLGALRRASSQPFWTPDVCCTKRTPPADPPGNASCSRGNGRFRVALSTLK